MKMNKFTPGDETMLLVLSLSMLSVLIFVLCAMAYFHV
jgi:hypothetical protein